VFQLRQAEDLGEGDDSLHGLLISDIQDGCQCDDFTVTSA
jgi:hypothetical protein